MYNTPHGVRNASAEVSPGVRLTAHPWQGWKQGRAGRAAKAHSQPSDRRGSQGGQSFGQSFRSLPRRFAPTSLSTLLPSLLPCWHPRRSLGWLRCLQPCQPCLASSPARGLHLYIYICTLTGYICTPVYMCTCVHVYVCTCVYAWMCMSGLPKGQTPHALCFYPFGRTSEPLYSITAVFLSRKSRLSPSVPAHYTRPKGYTCAAPPCAAVCSVRQLAGCRVDAPPSRPPRRGVAPPTTPAVGQ